MESRRESFCDRVHQQIHPYVYSSFNYIKRNIIIPIRHNVSWTLQAIAYFGGLSAVGIITANKVAPAGNLAYSIARVDGAMLRWVAVPTVILPTLVAAASRLQRSELGQYLGLNNRILTHKLMAYWITILSVAHSIAHYFYNKENYRKQPGITGIIMLLSLALPLGGVFFMRWLKPNSQHSYGLLVKRPHQIGAAIFITAFGFHTLDLRLLPFAGAMGCLLLIDRSYEFFSFKHKVTLKSMSPIDNTDYFLVRLTIPPHLNLHDYLPGQYLELGFKDSSLNRFLEAPHPFTIVTIDKRSHEIYLAIKKNGWWTKQLSKLEKQKNIQATIWGPHGSPLNNFYQDSEIAIITAGIGMTPFLAYIFWLVEQKRTSPILSLDISLAKFEEAFLWIKALNHPNIKRINFIHSVNFYITQQKISDIRARIEKIQYQKHLNFVFPEEPLYNPEKKEEKKQEKQEVTNNILIDKVDDEFFVSYDDPELMHELSPILEDDPVTDPIEPKKENKTPYQASPFNIGTPPNIYPALTMTGLFSTHEQMTMNEQRKSLEIRIYTHRMDINRIFSRTVFKKAAVCAGERLTNDVSVAAVNHGIELYKESF